MTNHRNLAIDLIMVVALLGETIAISWIVMKVPYMDKVIRI